MGVRFLRTLCLASAAMAVAAARPAGLFAQDSAAPAAAAREDAPKPKPKKKTGSKGYDYDKSKYKAFRVDPEPSVYRFDASGKPILPEKKKPSRKKPMTLPEEEDCQSDDSCKPAETD